MTNTGHWYTLTGTPCHTQQTKPGAANKLRPTNISDARKLKLLPSVSGYTKMLASAGLELHKMREVARACFDSPAHPGEEIDTYVASMLEKAGKDVAQAADLGTIIHKSIEDFFLTGKYEDGDVMLSTGFACRVKDLVDPAIAKFNSLNIEVSFAEKVLVNPKRGYAGTTDIVWRSDSELGILDWKSKRTKEGEKVRPIDSHPMQIAAYIAAHYGEEVVKTKFAGTRGYNVYVSTTQPGRVDVVEYSPETLHKSFEAFEACCQLWRYVNDYDPRVKDVDETAQSH
jgi:hypothetical protein